MPLALNLNHQTQQTCPVPRSRGQSMVEETPGWTLQMGMCSCWETDAGGVAGSLGCMTVKKGSLPTHDRSALGVRGLSVGV